MNTPLALGGGPREAAGGEGEPGSLAAGRSKSADRYPDPTTLSYEAVQGDALDLSRYPDGYFDLVFGSPPYGPQRLYLEDGQDLGIARDAASWVAWMLDVTTEALRVCRGPVFWVAAGWTEDRNYQPACEGLIWEWWKRGGECHAYRPCYWKRDGVPGSGGDEHFRAQIEYVMCFKRPGKLPWSNNTACGEKPKYRGGGACTNRLPNGERIVRMHGKMASESRIDKLQDGSTKRQKFKTPDKANPGNFLEFPSEEFPPLIHRSIVGGGHMGDPLAHRGEAPFPEDLPERFILSYCPPMGKVLDPFGGTGTTLCVAKKHWRSCVSLDLRPSQAAIATLRLAKVTPLMPALVFGDETPRVQDVQHAMF